MSLRPAGLLRKSQASQVYTMRPCHLFPLSVTHPATVPLSWFCTLQMLSSYQTATLDFLQPHPETPHSWLGSLWKKLVSPPLIQMSLFDDTSDVDPSSSAHKGMWTDDTVAPTAWIKDDSPSPVISATSMASVMCGTWYLGNRGGGRYIKSWWVHFEESSSSPGGFSCQF